MGAGLRRLAGSLVLTSLRHHPERSANPRVETQQMLYDKWEAQHGRCGLCQRSIPMPPEPGLLQSSADRINSTNSSYSKENVHITPLGCNLAKNQYSMDEFEAWLAIITAPVVALPETQAESA